MSPRSVRRLAAADVRRVAWKNGRGVTEELALWPPGATFERGDFDWRIARAAVDEAGPFSAFPGFERVLVITSGAGLALQHGTAAPRARVLRLQPYSFSGDWPTSAALIDGPVADVNVLTRRGVVNAEVSVLTPGPRNLHVRELLQPGPVFVHVLSGAVEARVTGAVQGQGAERTEWTEWSERAREAGEAGEAGDVGALRLAERESLWIGGDPRADGAPAGSAELAPLHLELDGSDESVVLLVRFGDDTAAG